MALSLKDLRKIARKFRFSPDQDVMNEESSLHSKVVQFCRSENPVARHTEKLIEDRFGVHAKRLAGRDPEDVIRCVTEAPQELGVPLWAILWNIATRTSAELGRLETVVFGVIHLLEHQLVKDHWESLIAEAGAEESQVNQASQIMPLKKSLLEIQREKTRLEKANEDLTRKLYAIEAQHVAAKIEAPHAHNDRAGCRCCAARKIERFKSALEETRSRNRELEAEVSELRREITELVAELSDRASASSEIDLTPAENPPQLNIALEGKSVALVGGIDSLECHYKSLIESMGGCFWRHNGNCCGGDKPLLDCIASADLVVCPIEVNSHMAAKSVKRLCKARGIPCCFPRSASLSGLKRAVEEHYSSANVA